VHGAARFLSTAGDHNSGHDGGRPTAQCASIAAMLSLHDRP
jgi:hypothetical protein